MPVELGHRLLVGQAVEVGKQIRGVGRVPVRSRAALAQQVVDQDLGVDLLLDVERRRLDHQIGPVLVVLVELGGGLAVREAVEVGEQVGRLGGVAIRALAALA